MGHGVQQPRSVPESTAITGDLSRSDRILLLLRKCFARIHARELSRRSFVGETISRSGFSDFQLYILRDLVTSLLGRARRSNWTTVYQSVLYIAISSRNVSLEKLFLVPWARRARASTNWNESRPFVWSRGDIRVTHFVIFGQTMSRHSCRRVEWSLQNKNCKTVTPILNDASCRCSWNILRRLTRSQFV